MLKSEGFTTRPGKGSHEMFACPSGAHKVSVPTGHKTISPAVHAMVVKAIAVCDCGKD
ncbi:UNVERIFIED_CONTAM: hypothetical protein DES50_102773 [Williamsia faeni]